MIILGLVFLMAMGDDDEFGTDELLDILTSVS